MKTFKIWVEREDITKDLIEVEANSLDEALEMAKANTDEPERSIHVDGRVLDTWEDGERGEWPEQEPLPRYPGCSDGLINSVEDLLK